MSLTSSTKIILLFVAVNYNAISWGATESLLNAVREGRLESVQTLLAQGADPNSKDDTGKTALMYASGLQQTTILKMLLDKGADVNAKDRKGNTALTWAAIIGNGGATEALLAKGALVDPKALGGWTPLMHAAFKGHLSVMRALLARGANPHITSDDPGGTALTMAAGNGQAESVRLLLQHGAKPDVKAKNGLTALAYAAVHGETAIIDVLVSGGADVNMHLTDGLTPLMMAALGGRLEAAKALLARGADPTATDNSGRTALNAVKNGSPDDLVLLLMDAKQRDPIDTAPSNKTDVVGQTKPTATGRDGLQYVWIPPGKFMMGCSPRDAECGNDEKPTHQVTISKGFRLGQTEVTQEAYQRVMGSNPSGFRGNRLPVEQVTWAQAKTYCEKIGGRLPTEAEWEYAARGGNAQPRYSMLMEIAWFSDNSESRTHQVGQKIPNAFGLYDMLGNVWEWVADGYASDYYKNGDAVDPKGPVSHSFLALRGGSWVDYAQLVRASDRNSVGSSEFRFSTIGFRCVGE